MPVSPIWFIYTTCGELTSTTYIPVGVGCWFQTRLYHGSVFGEISRTAERAEHPASMQAYIPVEVDSGLRRNDDSG